MTTDTPMTVARAWWSASKAGRHADVDALHPRLLEALTHLPDELRDAIRTHIRQQSDWIMDGAPWNAQQLREASSKRIDDAFDQAEDGAA